MARSKDAGQAALSGNGGTKARGRKSADGQEQVIKLKPMREALVNLLALKDEKDSAAAAFNEAVKAVAVRANLNASAVKKLVVAKSGDDFDDRNRIVQQTAELFSEFAGEATGEISRAVDAGKANGNGAKKDDGDPFSGSDLAEQPPASVIGTRLENASTEPPAGITPATLAGLDQASQDAAASSKRRATRQAAAPAAH
jgi:hypothetical protein